VPMDRVDSDSDAETEVEMLSKVYDLASGQHPKIKPFIAALLVYIGWLGLLQPKLGSDHRYQLFVLVAAGGEFNPDWERATDEKRFIGDLNEKLGEPTKKSGKR
jgi:hypothetical protein